MGLVERIVYKGSIPDSFFTIPGKIYEELTIKLTEDRAMIATLFKLEAEKNEIIIYTDHQHIRLVGIFPTTRTLLILDSGNLLMIWHSISKHSDYWKAIPV